MASEQLNKEPPNISLPLFAPIDEQFMVLSKSALVHLQVSGNDNFCIFLKKTWLQFATQAIGVSRYPHIRIPKVFVSSAERFQNQDKIIYYISINTKFVQLSVKDYRFEIGIDKVKIQKSFGFCRIPVQKVKNFSGRVIDLLISKPIFKKEHCEKIRVNRICNKEVKFNFQIHILKRTA